MSEIEIERKFLLLGLPSEIRKKCSFKNIHQGYFLVDPKEELEVRIRKKGERFFITLKKGKGIERIEKEEEISQKAFDILWPATEGKRIVKKRYIFGDWEIDTDFPGTERAVAEIELGSKDEEIEIPFEIKKVLIREVTGEEKYNNSSIALYGFPKE